jgi:hypothetical protein
MSTFYLVQWSNVWNRSGGLHGDSGTLAHLADTANVRGVTLCGKRFPADKGHAGGMTRCCKKCLKKSGLASVRELPWIRSVEEE